LLASASLALQRGTGIAAESTLVTAGTDGTLAAAQQARALVVGCPNAGNAKVSGRPT